MKRFRKIMAGVELADESQLIAQGGLRERCARALSKATWLAAESGAELRIVHALPISPRTHSMLERHGGNAQPSPVELGRKHLEELARAPREMGIETSTKIVVGAATAMLPAEALDWGADLIVVAGRDRSSRLGLLGSTAASLFQNADVPVWVTRRGTRDAMHDVMAAVSFDEHAHGVLRLAADTARRMGARFHGLHVADSPDPASHAVALDALNAWVLAHAPDVAIGSVQVLQGRTEDVIIEQAAAVPVDAVFVGPSKRSKLLSKFMGKTAPLLKRLHCSLICARAVPDSPLWSASIRAPAEAQLAV